MFELVLWHRYADGSAVDRSGHGNHGRIEGAAPAAGRAPGSSALAFDGVASRVVVLPSRNLRDLRALRASAWIWLEELGGRRTIMEGYGSFSLLIEPDGILEGTIYNGSRWEGVRSPPGLVPLRTWVKVTYVYDGIDTSVLYMDDTQVAAALRPYGGIDPLGWPFGLNVGAWPEADKRVFKGRIEEIKLWRLPM
jgi:hypothetical protein